MKQQKRASGSSNEASGKIAFNEADTMIGAILGHLRRAEGVSQTSLGDQIGVSRDKIRDFEAGRVALDLVAIEKIAEALQFDSRVFIETIGEYQLMAEQEVSAES